MPDSVSSLSLMHMHKHSHLGGGGGGVGGTGGSCRYLSPVPVAVRAVQGSQRWQAGPRAGICMHAHVCPLLRRPVIMITILEGTQR